MKRELGLLDVFMITTGSMIAAGLFVIPGMAYARTGPSVILSYLFAAVIALPTVLSAAELATAMPKAGGIYLFVSRSMGYGAGSIVGFARWFSISMKCAYALLGIGYYAYNYTDIEPVIVAIAVGLLFIIVNLIGIKTVGLTQVISTVALIGLLGFLTLWNLPSIDNARFVSFFPFGFRPVFSTAGFIFISYGGMLTVTGLAEEVKRPRRNIPLGIILGLLTTSLVYGAVVYVIVGTLPKDVLMNSLTPVADSAGIVLGQIGVFLATLAAMLAFITTANAGMASASRYPLAMSRDLLLPAGVQAVTSRNGVPFISIILTGVLITLTLIFLKLELLVEIASALLILTYILTNLALLLMRKKENSNYNPTFRAPLSPWLQVLGIAGLVLLLVQAGSIIILLCTFFCTAAYFFYWLRSKHLLKN